MSGRSGSGVRPLPNAIQPQIRYPDPVAVCLNRLEAAGLREAPEPVDLLPGIEDGAGREISELRSRSSSKTQDPLQST